MNYLDSLLDSRNYYKHSPNKKVQKKKHKKRISCVSKKIEVIPEQPKIEVQELKQYELIPCEITGLWICDWCGQENLGEAVYCDEKKFCDLNCAGLYNHNHSEKWIMKKYDHVL